MVQGVTRIPHYACFVDGEEVEVRPGLPLLLSRRGAPPQPAAAAAWRRLLACTTTHL